MEKYLLCGLMHRDDLRLLLGWRNAVINFGTIRVGKDSSIYFSSALMNDKNKYCRLSRGVWNRDEFLKNGETINTGDVHFSLHPNSDKPNLHIREQRTKKDLVKRTTDWFPVRKNLFLLRATTPPMQDCSVSKKRSIFLKIPDKHEKSVELYLIVFPKKEQIIPTPKGAIPIIVCNHKNYRISISLRLAEEKLPPALLFNDNLCNPD